MPIPFRVIEKCQPGVKRGGEKKYYARVAPNEKTTMDELIEKMKKRCALHEADIIRMIIALQLTIQEELVNGKIVRLDRLGTFYPSISSEGKDTPRQVTSASNKKAGINYRPGPELISAMANAAFLKV